MTKRLLAAALLLLLAACSSSLPQAGPDEAVAAVDAPRPRFLNFYTSW
jgi:uncharacterized lipoprotein